MSFTCSHHNVPEDWCLLLKTDCVPGRPGCVLRGKSVFLFPVEERIREKEQARREREQGTGGRSAGSRSREGCA